MRLLCRPVRDRQLSCNKFEGYDRVLHRAHLQLNLYVFECILCFFSTLPKTMGDGDLKSHVTSVIRHSGHEDLVL